MPHYKLQFEPEPVGESPPALTFEATDPSGALAIAQRHGHGRPAELWDGDKLVCRIAVDAEAGFWRVG